MARDLLTLMNLARKQANKASKAKTPQRIAGTIFFFNQYRRSRGIVESMDETRAWAAANLQPDTRLGEGWYWMKETT